MARADFAADLRRVKPDEVKPLGRQELAGRPVDVYALPGMKAFGMDHAEAVTLYADPETDLPVRIEVVVNKGGEPVGPEGRPATAVTLIFEEFEWNAPLADGLFSLDVPAGYTVVEGKQQP